MNKIFVTDGMGYATEAFVKAVAYAALGIRSLHVKLTPEDINRAAHRLEIAQHNIEVDKRRAEKKARKAAARRERLWGQQ